MLENLGKLTKIGINFQNRKNKYTSVYLIRSSMEMGPIRTLLHPCAKLLLPCLAALTLTSADPGFVTLSRRGLVVLVNASPDINLWVSLTQISDYTGLWKLQQCCLLPSTIFAFVENCNYNIFPKIEWTRGMWADCANMNSPVSLGLFEGENKSEFF